MSANLWLRLKQEYQAVLHDKAAMRKFSAAGRDWFFGLIALVVILLVLTSIWPAFERLPGIFFTLTFTLIPLMVGMLSWKLRGGPGWWVAFSLLLIGYLILWGSGLLDNLLKLFLKTMFHINIAHNVSPTAVLLGILGVYAALAFWRHWPLPNWAKQWLEKSGNGFILLMVIILIALNTFS